VFGAPEDQRFNWTGHNPAALAVNLRWTRLYVTVGDGVPKPSETSNWFGAIAEAELRLHSDDFVAAARAAGDDVTYVPRDGIHDWPYWREHLAAAIRWGLFAPVRETPTDWALKTVAMKGDAWGWRFEFQRRAPGEVITFARHGHVLSGEGSGRVAIKPPRGRMFVVRLPFSKRV
jgi:hypothetical protein